MDEKNEVKTGEKNISPDKGQNRMIMGILAYLGFLVLIPFFVSKEDSVVKFHVKQGLVLLVIEVIVWIVGMMFWSYFINSLMQLINIAVLILSILGIVNVVQGKEKMLPLVGQFSKYFTF
ncbi:MAG: hypothetical protein WC609_00020 [Candidatus Paceibacterota bacterium]|jgi:uncharacterized membrane protein